MNAGEEDFVAGSKSTQVPFKRLSYLLIGIIAGLGILVAHRVGLFDSNRTKINDWLKFHQLASLPVTATNLMYYQWNGLFTGETYVRVQMSREDVATFLTNSMAGLSQGSSEIFTPAHQHLPFPTNNLEMNANMSYYGRSRMAPGWYDPTITNKGRGYILWRGPNSQVYIDEDSSTVYLHSVKG